MAYTYTSTNVKGEPITLSAVAFWLGYFAGDVWNDIQPDNICLMEHYTITCDAETPTNTFASSNCSAAPYTPVVTIDK